jgi:hypothetical protein
MTDRTTWTGLRLLARDGTERVEAFIGRKVMDVWVESVEHRGGRQSLFRDQYNALGKRNLAAIERIVSAKYQRGAALQPPASLMSRCCSRISRKAARF